MADDDAWSILHKGGPFHDAPQRRGGAGPYRTAEISIVRQLLLEGIQNARVSQQCVLNAVTKRNDNAVLDRDDVNMLAKLDGVYRTACEHERELLKQLAQLEE